MRFVEHTVLWRAVFKKSYILLKRYWVNTASQLITIYFLFAVIFFGGKAIAGPTLENSLEGIIVGFFLFTMAMVAYSGISWDMIREAQWGTLEQLYMSPFGFSQVIVVKGVVNVAMSFLWGSAMLVLMMATARKMVYIDVLTVTPIIVFSLASALGIGFVFGGAALIYKRIENIFQIIQFGFIGLIAAPVGSYPILRLLPLSHGSEMLRRSMEDGKHIWEFGIGEIGLLVGVGTAYFVGGYLVFRYAQRKAREKGVLGHY